MGNIVLFLCIVLWGISTFLNRLSVEQLSPLLLQSIVGFTYICYIPIALKLSGHVNPLHVKWSYTSVLLTLTATCLSIGANIMLYSYLKGSNHTGTSSMFISLYPVVTLLLSAVFLHEQISIIKVAGIVVMVFGAILLSTG
jgi:drug/metabolite transporter (DMT)-like permease